jgi:hypothetical protein
MIRSVLAIPTAPNTVPPTVLPRHGIRRGSCARTLAAAAIIVLLVGCGKSPTPGAHTSTTSAATETSALPEVTVVASRS